MIVIHAGLKKAGSAAVQTFMSANAAALRRLGVDYPSVGRGRRKAHHQLANEIQGRDKFDPKFGTLSALADHWRGADGEVMLISSEMFEECEEAHIARLKTILDSEGEEFQILLVLRSLRDLMPSSYAQKIKHGRNTYDFDTFFAARMGERRVQYFETASRWAATFGWENIRVRLLESSHLVNGDLIDDLLTLIGVDLDGGEAGPFARPGMVNVAPGWRTLEAVRALYGKKHDLPKSHPLFTAARHPTRHRKTIAAEAARLADDLGWNRDRGAYMTLDQARRCQEVFTANIVALNERLAAKLPLPAALDGEAFGERTFAPDASFIEPEQLRQFYDALGAFHRKTVLDKAASGRPLDIPGKPPREEPPGVEEAAA